jgi:septum formation protein
MLQLPYKLILASQSPRRQGMLRDLGLPFEIRLKDIDESFSPDMPLAEVPVMLAQRKAAAFLPELQADELLITADTVVICGNKILNKPTDAVEAIAMLTLLSGAKHQVVTGFCLTTTQKQVALSDTTDVYFRELDKEEIAHYVAQYKPFDKAGSYGVQEWIGMTGITRIDGSYFNVVGLPVHRVYEALKENFL